MQELLRKADQWIEEHKDEFICDLQELVRIPSVSRADLMQPGAPFGPDCRKMLDFTLEWGRKYGFTVYDHEGYAGSICYGDPDNAIGMFVHMDVVPEGDGWIYPPYGATYLPEYDAIIGRGADDNKSSAVACLFVMRMLRDLKWPLKHGLRLYCGLSEETGMQDMTALLEKGMQFPKISLVPDSGFPVNFGQNGSVSADLSAECTGNLLSFDGGMVRNSVPDHAECVIDVSADRVAAAFAALDAEITSAVVIASCENGTRLTAAGKSAHTAMPQNGINAIWLLSRALTASGLLTGSCKARIAKLSELSGEYTGINEGVSYRDEISGSLSVVYSVAHLKDGVLTIGMNSRTPVTCDAQKLTDDLTNYWKNEGLAVTDLSCSKPYYVSPDDPYVVALQKVFHDVTGLDSKPFVMSGGNYAKVIPGAYSYGAGLGTKVSIRDFMPEGHGSFHGKDETVIMERLHNCARIYAAALAALDEMTE